MSINSKPKYCPCCWNEKVIFRYNISQSHTKLTFAGNRLDANFALGDIYSCSHCNLYFRFPTLSQKVINSFYTKLDTSHWQSGTDADIWREISGILDKMAPNKKILDFGCHTGNFLEYLGPMWTRFGIEPSRDAAHIASKKNIKVWDDIASVEHDNLHDLGAIIIIDVFEHLSDIHFYLGELDRRLSQGGLLVFFSGNSEALSWRIMHGYYWYLGMPEHMSFYNLKWARWFERNFDYDLVHHSRLSHTNDIEFSDACKRAIGNVAFRLLKPLAQTRFGNSIKTLPTIGKPFRWDAPMPWWTAKDHLLLVFRRR